MHRHAPGKHACCDSRSIAACPKQALALYDRFRGTGRPLQPRSFRGREDTQPGMSRQTVKGALQEAAQTEGGYLLKLLIVSAIGAAAVKYGSLFISTPFQPSGIIALTIITVPCLMYSGLLLSQRNQ